MLNFLTFCFFNFSLFTPFTSLPAEEKIVIQAEGLESMTDYPELLTFLSSRQGVTVEPLCPEKGCIGITLDTSQGETDESLIDQLETRFPAMEFHVRLATFEEILAICEGD